MHNYGVDINIYIAVSNVVIVATGHFEMSNPIAVKYLMRSMDSDGYANSDSIWYGDLGTDSSDRFFN
jgi:hypothetical protein